MNNELVKQFETCKYDHIQLAAQFLKMAEKFIGIHKSINAVLDFGQGGCSDWDEPNFCGTALCHGGWAHVVLNPGISPSKVDYNYGANDLAMYLGFEDAIDLVNWAEDYPEYWGNFWGYEMFVADGYVAFGFKEGEPMTLLDIANHYMKVANNLLSFKE